MYRGAQAVVRQAWVIVQVVKNETLFYDIQQPVEVPDVVLSGIAFSEIRYRLVVSTKTTPPGRRMRKTSSRLIVGESTCSRTPSQTTKSCEWLAKASPRQIPLTLSPASQDTCRLNRRTRGPARHRPRCSSSKSGAQPLAAVVHILKPEHP